ncbi:cytochrome P450 4C1-like isoform X2 [Linepithema humile]|uniref:cytochrome P450 4C1-like isoform X2 n=1 Tax=Linepithema humile TaxID=83485 RepID=UPI00351DB515
MFVTVTLITLICLGVSYILSNFWHRSFIKKVNALPGPKAYPLIGNALYFLGVKAREMEQVVTTMMNDFSSPIRVWFGNTPYIILYDEEQIKAVLQSQCFEKSSLYEFFKPVLGTGLITSPENMLGVKLESQLLNRIYKCATSVKKIWNYRINNILLHINVIFNLSTTKWRQQKQLNCVNLLVNELKQRRHAFEKRVTTKSNSETVLFDILLEACHKGRLTQQELWDHMVTMLLSATDTTAVTINFVIFMLANFPEVQEKAYKELSEIYGIKSPKSVPIKYDDLQKMNYLNRVIKETMRLFPAIPVVARFLTEDLKIGETILPKGADVFMSIFHMHRNKKHWSNPLMFDPDRFLPEKQKHCSKYFIPFSNGLRNCIGQKYAMISMKIVLATLIRTFEFKVNKNIKINDIKLNMDISLCTIDPLKVKIKKRDY